MKIKDFGIILFIILIIIVLYLEFFVCGGLKGTLKDIPRYCWWLR